MPPFLSLSLRVIRTAIGSLQKTRFKHHNTKKKRWKWDGGGGGSLWFRFCGIRFFSTRMKAIDWKKDFFFFWFSVVSSDFRSIFVASSEKDSEEMENVTKIHQKQKKIEKKNETHF